MKFETGKHYRTRDGRKATVWLIRPHYMVGEVECCVGAFAWTLGGGYYSEATPCNSDLVAEWTEPARLRVVLIKKRMGNAKRLQVFREDEFEALGPGMYEVIDTFELVEGEGLGTETKK